MIKASKISLTVFVLTAFTSVANAQSQTTHIREYNGNSTTVKTNSYGTQTTTNGNVVYTSGGNSHASQVRHSTQQGGVIIRKTRP